MRYGLPHSFETLARSLLSPRAAWWRLTKGVNLEVSSRIAALAREGRFTGISGVIDAGANEGLFGIACAKVLPAARIFCFEPVPTTFARLVGATKSYSNIVPVNAGLGA